MRNLRQFAILFMLGVVVCLACAKADTLENRREAATRYLQVVQPEAMMQAMAEKTAEMLPEEQRQGAVDLMTRHFDQQRMTQATQDALVKHFTVRGLDALHKFYSSPEGRSSMGKMGVYMADVMPTMFMELELAKKRAAGVVE